jgi:DNA-binding winged helix-turn-helix (wHTH) protein
MKKRHCNYCGQELPEIRLGVRLTPLKARIFDLIQRGGEDGIDRRDLFDIVYAGEDVQRTVLKSHIHQINEEIEDAGYRIVGHSVARLARRGK